eukprot:s2869_g2.t1
MRLGELSEIHCFGLRGCRLEDSKSRQEMPADFEPRCHPFPVPKGSASQEPRMCWLRWNRPLQLTLLQQLESSPGVSPRCPSFSVLAELQPSGSFEGESLGSE